MKRFPILQVALIMTLMVVAVSCGMPMGAQGGYYEDMSSRSDVYYGNGGYGNNVIVVERDPYTGRYYQVSPYGGGAIISPYGGVYGRSNPRVYNDSRYYNNSRNRGGYVDRGNVQQNRQVTEQRQQQRNENIRQMEQTKESVLGKKKD